MKGLQRGYLIHNKTLIHLSECGRYYIFSWENNCTR